MAGAACEAGGRALSARCALSARRAWPRRATGRASGGRGAVRQQQCGTRGSASSLVGPAGRAWPARRAWPRRAWPPRATRRASGERASGERGAVRHQQCGMRGSASPLVCTPDACSASSEGARHVAISLCFGGRGLGGRMRAARPRGRRSQLHARSTCWQQPRARAPQRSRGKRTETWLLGRHHHAMVMTWARWTRRVKAARAATSLASRDAHDRPIGHLGRGESACKFERPVLFESPSTSRAYSNALAETRKSCKGRRRRHSRVHDALAARAAMTCRVHPAQVMIIA